MPAVYQELCCIVCPSYLVNPLSYSVQAAITVSHRLGDLNNRKQFFNHCGG